MWFSASGAFRRAAGDGDGADGGAGAGDGGEGGGDSTPPGSADPGAGGGDAEDRSFPPLRRRCLARPARGLSSLDQHHRLHICD